MTYKTLKELFKAICDAIRYKDGSTEEINHQDIPARIRTLITSATSIFQRNKKVQPSETEQTVYPDDGYDGLSSVTVEAIPSTYIGSAVTKKEAFEYIPGTSDITINENQYLIGTQTIKGDTDLISENIKSGVTIFNVEGSYIGSGNGIDTSNATVTPNDMVSGITAYGADGTLITGELKHESLLHSYHEGVLRTRTVDGEHQIGLIGYGSSEERRVFGDGAGVIAYVPASAYGDATATDVAQGKTFTSASGLKAVGTASFSGGLDTSDATATANDIASGVTAYVNGEKIAGDIPVISAAKAYTDVGVTFTSSDKDIRMYKTMPEKTIINKGVVVNFYSDGSNFGDATPEDVIAGKTFTSSSGLKVTGTAIIGGDNGSYNVGDVVKAYETSKTFTSGYSSSTITINYSDNVGVDTNQSGKVSLKGSDTSGISGLTLSSVDDCEVLKGKYIVVSTSGSSYLDPYYIPEDATFTYSGSYNRTFSVDKCNQMFIIA